MGEGSGLSPNHTGSLAHLVYPKSHLGAGSGLSPGHTGSSGLSQISPGRGWNGIPVGTEPPCRLQGWGLSLNEHFRHYGNSLLTPSNPNKSEDPFFIFIFFWSFFPLISPRISLFPFLLSAPFHLTKQGGRSQFQRQKPPGFVRPFPHSRSFKSLPKPFNTRARTPGNAFGQLQEKS